MHLLVIRHAIAEDRDEYAATGASDDERPLTSFGKRRMRRNAEGLRRAVPQIDLLAASPLVRAQQTARILATEYGAKEIETVESLAPDRHPREFLTWLAKQSPDATVAVVGHVQEGRGGADRVRDEAGGTQGAVALAADPGAVAHPRRVARGLVPRVDPR